MFNLLTIGLDCHGNLTAGYYFVNVHRRIFFVALYFIIIYNNLVSLKHNVSKAWANVDVLLKQRHDELPKLVETCKQIYGI